MKIKALCYLAGDCFTSVKQCHSSAQPALEMQKQWAENLADRIVCVPITDFSLKETIRFSSVTHM